MDGRDQVYELLQCPYDWASIVSSEKLTLWLNITWMDHVNDRQVRNEATRHFTFENFIADRDRVAELSVEELEFDLGNLNYWIDRARTEYMSFFCRLAKLENVGRSKYPKHYLTTSTNDDDALLESKKRGVSVLFPWVDSKVQRKILWLSIAEWIAVKIPHIDPEDRWQVASEIKGIFDVPSARLAASLPFSIGACDGQESPFCRLELDYCTPQFHMYPITEREYKKQGFEINVKDWDSTL